MAEQTKARMLNEREVNTLLCALRAMYRGDHPVFCDPRACDHLDESEPLTKPEALALCGQIRLDGVAIEYDDEAAS